MTGWTRPRFCAIGAPVVAPSPTHGPTVVSFEVHAPVVLELTVVDALGRVVVTRSLGRVSAGPQRVPLDLRTLPAGVYRVVLSDTRGRSIGVGVVRA